MIERIILATVLLSGGAVAGECPRTLLVSGYGSANVHRYDACTGEFIGNLDSGGRIRGTQAVRAGEDGFLYVASEENGRILRYRADDFTFDRIVAGDGASAPLNVVRPTGIAIAADGTLFVAGYDSNDVVRIDPETGSQLAAFELGNAGLSGADAGIAFAPDGRLLVPGFDSSNIVALDPDTGVASVWASGGNLVNPRVIRWDEANDRFLVTSWGSNRVLAFDTAGNELGQVLRTAAPTGLVIDSDGTLLVTTDQLPQVTRYQADGSGAGVFVERGAGGLAGATFLTLIGEAGGGAGEPVPTDQAWLIGVGSFDGLTLEVEAVETAGGRFGSAFDPAVIERTVWGTIRFSLVACGEALLEWMPLDPAIEAGSYPAVRVAANAAATACEADGIGPEAAQGTWFGGAVRDGEGVLIDVLSDGRGILAWYTYVP